MIVRRCTARRLAFPVAKYNHHMAFSFVVPMEVNLQLSVLLWRRFRANFEACAPMGKARDAHRGCDEA